MSDETSLATIEAPDTSDLAVGTHHAIAINAEELQNAGSNLRTFLEAKIAEFDAEIAEYQEAEGIAIKRKWASHRWWGPIYRAQGRKAYYVKLLAAVNAGYTIVPNLPCDWFAIRVDRNKPHAKAGTYLAKETWHDTPTLTPEAPDYLPVGSGHYESPEAEHRATSAPLKKGGKEEWVRALKVTKKFRPIEFPFAAAHPVVMNATDHAMKQLIFDRIGIVPQNVKPKVDPLIVGQIQSRSEPDKFVSFIIGWYLDMRTL